MDALIEEIARLRAENNRLRQELERLKNERNERKEVKRALSLLARELGKHMAEAEFRLRQLQADLEFTQYDEVYADVMECAAILERMARKMASWVSLPAVYEAEREGVDA